MVIQSIQIIMVTCIQSFEIDPHPCNIIHSAFDKLIVVCYDVPPVCHLFFLSVKEVLLHSLSTTENEYFNFGSNLIETDIHVGIRHSYEWWCVSAFIAV